MRILKNIKFLIVAAITISFIPACGSADSASYPQEAYNNPIGEAIASAAYVYKNSGDSVFSTGVNADAVLCDNGMESAEESELYAILGDKSFVNEGCSYYYKMRVYTADGEEVISPIVYAIPYENDNLIVSSLKEAKGSSGETFYYCCYGYSYMSYQYIQDEGGYKLITKSNMILACALKTVYSLSYAAGNPVKTDISADWQYEIAPYFDDAVTSYLSGVKIPESVCIKKFSVTESNTEICKLTFDL